MKKVQAKQCAKCIQNNAKETIVMNNAKKTMHHHHHHHHHHDHDHNFNVSWWKVGNKKVCTSPFNN